ncbi:MAG: UvrB/UvrC motif-containing protein [Planctomycetes bacterium]|mgnify:CR=1 FL=1|nr:UvrB/UvrC motif-containing protein [Planctomycetota bacterium]
MQYCTACQKAIAEVVIMDLSGGAVSGSQHLCKTCAEQLGVGLPKPPDKHTAHVLEELLQGMQQSRSGPAKPRREACPGCGLAPADFRSKGRFGCPRCYETFRGELLPLLQRIHEAQTHCGRLPGRLAAPTAPRDDRALAELRRKLEDAVRGERYEEAARLRDQLRTAERGEGAAP